MLQLHVDTALVARDQRDIEAVVKYSSHVGRPAKRASAACEQPSKLSKLALNCPDAADNAMALHAVTQESDAFQQTSTHACQMLSVAPPVESKNMQLGLDSTCRGLGLGLCLGRLHSAAPLAGVLGAQGGVVHPKGCSRCGNRHCRTCMHLGTRQVIYIQVWYLHSMIACIKYSS